jgi:CIC family chloride channel protein
MIVIAMFVGILGGLGAILFRLLVDITHNVFFLGHFSIAYNEILHTLPSKWGMGIIMIPMLGGLIVIWLIKNYASDQRGLSVPEIMYAIFCKEGRIQVSGAVAKAIASAITIGTGGSVGREGPVFQIGATLSSIVSDFTHLSLQQRQILLAAGVAASTAVIFHAPLTGIVFASEMLLIPLSIFGLLIIIISTIAATVMNLIISGMDPLFSTQLIGQMSDYFTFVNIFIYGTFGIIIGFVSVILIRGVYGIEDIFNKIFKNAYFGHICGMLITGCLIYISMIEFGHYYIEGVGFATVQDCLNNQLLNPWLLVFLIIAKMLATCFTLGSGASGGIFSPSLFIGATLGSFFGLLINLIFPALGITPVIFAVIGMAAMLGSVTGAILTSIVLIPELVNNAYIVIPVIYTVMIAHFVRQFLCRENIYTLKLIRRGVNLKLIR